MNRNLSNNNIGVENLIVFILYSFGKDGKLSFEDLVKECFANFPKTFSLKRYSKWPDTRKLDRPLRDLRKKGLVSGNPESFFSLTLKGKKLAEELAKTLRQRKLL